MCLKLLNIISCACEGICRSTVLGEHLYAVIKVDVAEIMDEWNHQPGEN